MRDERYPDTFYGILTILFVISFVMAMLWGAGGCAPQWRVVHHYKDGSTDVEYDFMKLPISKRKWAQDVAEAEFRKMAHHKYRGRYAAQEPSPSPEPVLTVKEEYRLAAQSFDAGKYDETEIRLERIYQRDKNPITLLNIARCRERLGHWDDAAGALGIYFGQALTSAQSADGAESLRQARLMLKKLSKESGHVETSGRMVANATIAKMRAGDFDEVTEIERAFHQTYDFSLYYWIALADFRNYQRSFCPAPKCTYQHFNTFVLEGLRSILNAYFLGTEVPDAEELEDARRLMDEVDAEYRKEVERERVEKVSHTVTEER